MPVLRQFPEKQVPARSGRGALDTMASGDEPDDWGGDFCCPTTGAFESDLPPGRLQQFPVADWEKSVANSWICGRCVSLWWDGFLSSFAVPLNTGIPAK